MQQTRVGRGAGWILRRGMAPLGESRRTEEQGQVPCSVGAQIRREAQIRSELLMKGIPMNELRKYVADSLRGVPKTATRQEVADSVLAALQQQYVVSKRW